MPDCDANYLESFKVVTHEYWCAGHPMLHYVPDENLVFLCGSQWGHFTGDMLEIECQLCRIKFAEKYMLND